MTSPRLTTEPGQNAKAQGKRFSGYTPKSGWRNVILGTLLVFAGISAALITVWGRRRGDLSVTSAAAIASLIIAALLIVFVLPPLARSARAEVSRFDVPFEVTTGGVIFVSILVVTGFAAWNTGNNLLFLVFSVLVSTLVVSWNASRASLRNLAVQARFPDHIFAGEPAPVLVTISNHKRFLPALSILVGTRSPHSREQPETNGGRNKSNRERSLAYFAYVPSRNRSEQRVEKLFTERGHVLITGFELSTRFPFGFFKRRRLLRARNVDLIIYPRPEPISDELHLLPINAGRTASTRVGGGHDLLSLRDYQPHDDLRHMDWKATARARRLTVRQFAAEDERRVTITLDTFLAEGSTREGVDRFERGITTVASLLAHFIEEGAEVCLVIGADAGRFGLGREHLHRCLRRLALVAPATQSERGEVLTDRDALAKRRSFEPPPDRSYVILVTTAQPGSISSKVWRTSHVIYL